MDKWMKQLKVRCKASIDESFASLIKMGGKVFGETGKQHGFLDRGSSVLAVAHLDFNNVKEFHFASITTDEDMMVFCPRLDDRLGVFTALDVMSEMGMNVDVLLTENEEVGRSTARDFKPLRQYNWILGLDRNGTDFVTYQFYDFQRVLKPIFGERGIGSYSDLSDLGHLKALGFNMGIGYHDEHQYEHFFSLAEYIIQMGKLRDFFEGHETKAYAYAPAFLAPAKKKKKKKKKGSRKSRKEKRYRKEFGSPIGTIESGHLEYILRLSQAMRDNGFKTTHQVQDKGKEKSAYRIMLFSVTHQSISKAWECACGVVAKLRDDIAEKRAAQIPSEAMKKAKKSEKKEKKTKKIQVIQVADVKGTTLAGTPGRVHVVNVNPPRDLADVKPKAAIRPAREILKDIQKNRRKVGFGLPAVTPSTEVQDLGVHYGRQDLYDHDTGIVI